MASVSGASPVTFVSEDPTGHVGTQYHIPIPFISYNAANSQVSLSGWQQWPNLTKAEQALAVAVVQSLINQGFLTPTPP